MVNDLIRQLATVDLLAEARLPMVNDLIRQLATVDLLPETALLGEVILDQALVPVPNYSDGSQLLQAALLVPGGFGIVLWDREEYLAVRNSHGATSHEMRVRFIAFDQVGSAIKALLLPQVEPLLDRLLLLARPLQR